MACRDPTESRLTQFGDSCSEMGIESDLAGRIGRGTSPHLCPSCCTGDSREAAGPRAICRPPDVTRPRNFTAGGTMVSCGASEAITSERRRR